MHLIPEQLLNRCYIIKAVSEYSTGFPRLLENPGKSWNFYRKIFRPENSWKMTLVLENFGNLLARSWKVLEFARQ